MLVCCTKFGKGKMDGAPAIMDSIIEKILDYLVKAVCTAIIGIIGLIVGRLWSRIVHEIQNQNPNKKIQQLERVMYNIKRKTDEAGGRKPEESVSSERSEWLKDAEKLLEEIYGRKTGGNFWEKVIYSWYLLVKKSRAIDELLKRAPLLDYEDFESRKAVFEEIMKALKDERRLVIGIWGMAGVGKTAMVEKVRALAEKEQTFDEVVLAVVSQNPVVSKVQDELAYQLGLELKGHCDVGRADSLRTGLLKDEKKILVILDDIWNPLDLAGIGIPFPDGINGIRILLTSRKQTVCHAMQDPNPIFIQQLSEEEAWNLFRKKVGNPIKSHDIPPDLAQQVCRKCGGLPIAVLAVAGALKSKDKRIWKNALKQLNTFNLKEIEGVNEQVCASLMFSYNQLKHKDTESCFLFCCLFPEDSDIPIELLMRLGSGMGFLGDVKKLKLGEARNRVYDLVDKLKDYSLLLEGKDKEHVKMHDVVRDVAISIASQGQFLIETGEDLEEWPEQETSDSYTAISLLFRSIGIQEIPDGWECPELHTLMLRSSFYYGDFDIPDTIFDAMKTLKVLFLDGGKISSLPPTIQNLNDLRVLHLKCWKLCDITLIGKLERLEMLILCCSGVHVLPIEIGNLTRLRLLDLRGCTALNFISPRLISHLPKLEDLFMPMKSKIFWGCGGIENHEKCADLGELIPLSQLESLEICVPNFDMWPQGPFYPFLTRLTSFKICINSTTWYEEYGASKKILKLKDVPLRCGVDVLLKRAEALDISGCKDLKDCSMDHGDGESFSNLACLHASSCEGVQQFIVHVLERQSHLESFRKLRVLKIEKCNFKYLLSPSAAKVLVQLEKLTIKDCENVEAIVGRYEAIVIGFSSLKHLWLGNLPKLVGFYPKMERTSGLGESLQFPVQPLFNEKVAFTELQELRIDNAGGGKARLGLHLPAQQSFSKLRKLRVENMNGLSTIGSSTIIPRLQNLQELYLRNCGSLRAVFQAERNEVSGGEEVVAIDNEKAIPDAVFQLPTLHSLSIWRCGLLEVFFWDSCPRSNEATNTARPFFSDRVSFPELETLVIDNVGELEEIGLPAQPSFSKLRQLRVQNMNHLPTIGSSTLIPWLQSLKQLIIVECGSLRAVFAIDNDEVFQLPALQSLGIWKCGLLEEFCCDSWPGSKEATNTARPFFGDRVAFPELEKLVIDNVGELEEIVLRLPAQQSFSKLRELRVENMNHLSTIGSSTLIPKLQSLQRLIIINCGSLRAVFAIDYDEVFQLPALELLVIRRCGLLDEFCWDSWPGSKEATNTAKPFFSDRIGFPKLGKLELRGMKVKEIWKEDGLPPPPPPSFCNLSQLLITECPTLERVILPRLHHWEILDVWDCDSVREVIVVVGAGSELRSITLIKLPNLVILPWEAAAAAAVGGGGSVSSPPASFPASQCLSRIKIERCGRLRNLFSSPSTALAFLAPQKLQHLEIRDCEEMEEIVSRCSDASSHALQIIFPQLQELELVNLPNLTNLCPSGYLLFPGSSPHGIKIENCPKLHASAPESNAIGDESLEASSESSIRNINSESFPNLLASAPQNDDAIVDETDDTSTIDGGPNLQALAQGTSSDASRDK